MRRRLLTVFLTMGLLVPMLNAHAQPIEPPLPEPGMLEPVPAGDCLPESPYESHVWYWSYVDACKRLRFSYGPIVVRPGQNDVLLGPVTLEKPAYSGYWTRFKPDLVDVTGTPPSINDVHLHHANWLTPEHGIMLATGEEKTVATWPEGYGVPTPIDDPWIFLYMVHNTGATPMNVYITWEMDFIAEADADDLGIAPVYPVWLDVQGNDAFHEEQTRTSSNPVFNVQRGYGHLDPETGRHVCVWPNENCAMFDTYGDVSAQQGLAVSGVPGTEKRITSSTLKGAEEGTLIGLGGHLHPGGLRDEVSLVRDGVEKPIFVSDAVYWDRDDPSRAGGPTNSWDFSMTVNGASIGWKVKVKVGDIIRIKTVQENALASWYENMGIVMAFVAPDDPHAPAGVDVFEDDVELSRGIPTTALWPDGFAEDWANPPGDCTPDLAGTDGLKNLCLRGQITHGHLDEAGEFGGCPPGGCLPLPDGDGDVVDQIFMASFLYGTADMGLIQATGTIPRVKVDEPVRFWNLDSPADIWHTITRCAAPCTGVTGLDYPLADGGNGPGDVMDFDSGEIGYGVQFSPAKSHIDRGDWSLQKKVESGLFWDFTPTETGTYTFWCRVHPFMRGAIKVVE